MRPNSKSDYFYRPACKVEEQTTMPRSTKVYRMEEGSPTKPSNGTKPTIVRKDGISAHYTLINFLKGMIGPGCFSLPLAMKNAGLWGGFGLIFFFGTVTCICMMKLVHCSQYLATLHGELSLDYGNMAAVGFKHSFPWLRRYSKHASIFVNTCLLLLQLGVCSVFYIFVADHAKEIIDACWPNNGVSMTTVLLLAVFPFLILCSIRAVKHMSYVSLFGNLLMVGSLIIILEALITSPHIIDQLPSFTGVKGVILASGSILYSFEGQAMVLPLENKLTHPVEMVGYTGVLSTGMSLVTIIYASCGFFGYVTYGDKVQGSITLNMPDTPLNFLVKVLLMLVVFTGYLVQHYVIVEMLFPKIRTKLTEKGVNNVKTMILEYVFRYAIVVLSMFFALAVPNLEQIIPLVGVTVGMLLALVIPPVLETITFLPYWQKKKMTWTIVSKCITNAFLVLLGITFMIMGTKDNIQNL